MGGTRKAEYHLHKDGGLVVKGKGRDQSTERGNVHDEE